MKENLVNVEVDLDNDILLSLALIAHKRDMKLNDLFIEIIKEGMDKKENVK